MLQQNPPVLGKRLAQQRAAAMREAVQEDEDALASGAPSSGAVASLAPNRVPAPSLWARAISGLAADSQPLRPSMAQRLSRPGTLQPSGASEPAPGSAAKERSDLMPTGDHDEDKVRSPRKRSRRGEAVSDADAPSRESVRSEEVKRKKHKHRRE